MTVTADAVETRDTAPVGSVPLVEFPCGLPGFAHLRRFVLVRLDDEGLVQQLRSVEDEAVSFVVVPSVAYFPAYAPEIDDATAGMLGLAGDGADDALVLLIVTIGESLSTTTANLLAPVVLNTRTLTGAQVVLDGGHPLRAPLAG